MSFICLLYFGTWQMLMHENSCLNLILASNVQSLQWGKISLLILFNMWMKDSMEADQLACWSESTLFSKEVLKFGTLVVCPKGLDKQDRPSSDCFWGSSLIRVFPVCYSDKQFLKEFQPWLSRFYLRTERKKVWNFTYCRFSAIVF